MEYRLIFVFRLEKASLLSRLFRRSGRSKQRQIETYSAQFPPAEWFNSKAVHLHSVGTQTSDLVRNSADDKSEEVCPAKCLTGIEHLTLNVSFFFYFVHRMLQIFIHYPNQHSMMVLT